MDIRLPDIEGTELLAKMKEVSPNMINIMITGFASLENAIGALNLGADAYIMKPLDVENLLRVVHGKLSERKKAQRMTEERVTHWIETRIRKLEQQRQAE